MDRLFILFLNKLKEIKNLNQLSGFTALVFVFAIFITIAFAKQNGVYPLSILLLVGFSMLLIFILTIIAFVNGQFFEYLKSKDWNRRTNEYLKSVDPSKTPAGIASSEFRLNEGKKLAYRHCLEEIAHIQNNNESIDTLKDRVQGALNSIK